jgi:outer membrane usher protein
MRYRWAPDRLLGTLALALSCCIAQAGDVGLLLLDATVNGQGRGPALFGEDESGAFFATSEDLSSWGVRGQLPESESAQGREFINLSAIEGIGLSIDRAAMSVEIVLPARLMGGTRLAVREESRLPPVASVGAYMDYDFSYSHISETDNDTLGALLRPTLFSSRGTFSTDFRYLAADDDADDENGFTRLESTYRLDNPENITTLSLGDAILDGGMMGPSVRFGGIQLATNFATRPNLVTFPLPSVSGEARLPTAVDLFVNGGQVYSGQVGPGSFQFDNVPAVTGTGEIRMVTVDALGREQVVTTDFYATQRLLDAGLSEYSVNAGLLRQDFGVESNAYGGAFAAGLYRRGLTKRLTAEGHAEASGDVRAIGGGVSRLFRNRGVIGIGVTASNGDGGSGFRWHAGYDHQGRVVRFSALAEGTTDEYRQLGFDDENEIPEFQLASSTGFNLVPIASIGLAYVHQEFHDGRDIDVYSVSGNSNLPAGISMNFFSRWSRDDETVHTVGVTFSRSFGGRRSANLQINHSEGDSQLRTEVRHEPPLGPGIGYRVGANVNSEDNGADGAILLNTDIGTHTFEAATQSGDLSWRASSGGSAVWLGGRGYLAREIRESFAVVQTNGFAGVNVYLENSPVGVTGEDGKLLVPGLRPYQENRLRIRAEDIPFGAEVDTLELTVAPYYQTGSVVEFPVRESQNVIARLRLAGGQPVPEGAMAAVVQTGQRVPIGLDGTLYLSGVSGSVSVEVEWGESSCRVDLPKGAEGRPIYNAGELLCESR